MAAHLDAAVALVLRAKQLVDVRVQAGCSLFLLLLGADRGSLGGAQALHELHERLLLLLDERLGEGGEGATALPSAYKQGRSERNWMELAGSKRIHASGTSRLCAVYLSCFSFLTPVAAVVVGACALVADTSRSATRLNKDPLIGSSASDDSGGHLAVHVADGRFRGYACHVRGRWRVKRLSKNSLNQNFVSGMLPSVRNGH